MSAGDEVDRQGGIEQPDLDALWGFNDPAATEARFRALLPAAASGSPK
jgi:hypothetical protein